MGNLSQSTDFNVKYDKEIFESLKCRKLIKENKAGLVSIGKLGFLKKYFISKFNEIAREYGAEFQDYSCFIPQSFLTKIEFKNRFPQCLFSIKNNECEHIDVELSPAECFHTFDFYENKDLSEDKIISCVGRCFRNELGETFQRTWDFTMYELVFIGSKEFVIKHRKDSLKKVMALVKKLKLNVAVEDAKDLFFLNLERTDAFETYDLERDSKYELNASLPHNKERLAISSFNVHGTFFGDKLNITYKRNPGYSGCTAFGLERWIYAFISQHGMDVKQWPEEIKKEVAHEAKVLE
jgi:seryl-tRNA synthetase